MSRLAWLVSVICNIGMSACFLFLPPATLATHFDFNGQPNGYMNVRFYAVFGMVVAVCANALMFFIWRMFRREAGLKWANIPNREFWMQTPDRRKKVSVKLRETLEWTGVFFNGVFCGAHALIYAFNFQREFAGPTLVNSFVAATMLTSIGFLIFVFRSFVAKD